MVPLGRFSLQQDQKFWLHDSLLLPYYLLLLLTRVHRLQGLHFLEAYEGDPFSKLNEPFLDFFLLIFDGEDELGCRFRSLADL
jgi:hypothetical protein